MRFISLGQRAFLVGRQSHPWSVDIDNSVSTVFTDSFSLISHILIYMTIRGLMSLALGSFIADVPDSEQARQWW